MGESLTETYERLYTEQLDRVAEQLVGLADRVKREGTLRKDRRGDRQAVYLATQVVHELQWGFANLRLSALLSNAELVDLHSHAEKEE